MFGIDDAIAAGLKIIDKVIPDPQAKAQAILEAQRMKQAGEFKEIDTALAEAQMQADVNKVEAGNANLFVSGWRPFIGWVCGSAFAWHFIGAPLFVWVAGLIGSHAPMPNIEMSDLFTLLLGMLGLGSMRTVEKLKGAA